MLKNELRSSYVALQRKERPGQNGPTGKLVMQCSDPHLLGQVKVFGPSIVSEAQRILFEQSVPTYLRYRQPGTRIYLHIVGTYFRSVNNEEERQYAPRYSMVARDMMQEAIDSGLVSRNDLDYYRQKDRTAYHYTDDELAQVLDDFHRKGY